MITIKTIADPRETFHNYKIILKDKDAPSDFWVGENRTADYFLIDGKSLLSVAKKTCVE